MILPPDAEVDDIPTPAGKAVVTQNGSNGISNGHAAVAEANGHSKGTSSIGPSVVQCKHNLLVR